MWCVVCVCGACVVCLCVCCVCDICSMLYICVCSVWCVRLVYNACRQAGVDRQKPKLGSQESVPVLSLPYDLGLVRPYLSLSFPMWAMMTLFEWASDSGLWAQLRRQLEVSTNGAVSLFHHRLLKSCWHYVGLGFALSIGFKRKWISCFGVSICYSLFFLFS